MAKAFVPTIKLSTWTPNCQRKADARQRYQNDYKGKKSRWMGAGIVPPQKGGSGRAVIKMAHGANKPGGKDWMK